jgi:hypothetical protein
MDRRDVRLAASHRLRKRLLVVTLAVILGATVYGGDRGLDLSGFAVPGSDGLPSRADLGHTLSALTRLAQDAATLGILSGTVLSRMDPGVRRSILAAVDEIPEVRAGRPAAPPVTRCAAKNLRAGKPVRCSRA